jgi:hypothetical protein
VQIKEDATMRRLILTLTLVALVPAMAAAQGNYWYYDRNGGILELDVYDSLVEARIDPSHTGFSPVQFAEEHESLVDDFELELLPGNFFLFGITPGYTLEQVMSELRSEEEVFMVNPVIRNIYDMPSYPYNRLLVIFNQGVTDEQICSINEELGLTLTGTQGTDLVLYLLDYEQKTSLDITAMARSYYESGLSRVVEPSTMFQGIDFGNPLANEESHDEIEAVPEDYALAQNYPNPFNPTTDIRFELARPGVATCEVYNLLGQRVAVLIDKYLQPGRHAVTWNGTDHSGKEAASGIYFYRLTVNGSAQNRKMVLMR